MGEIADMMLDGTLCEGCSVYLEGDAGGYPRYCHSCKPHPHYGISTGYPRKCRHCGKVLKSSQSMADHNRAKHPTTRGVKHVQD